MDSISQVECHKQRNDTEKTSKKNSLIFHCIIHATTTEFQSFPGQMYIIKHYDLYF